MFKLSDIIKRFNQTHGTKISLKKNWGLFYLRSESLALLNKNAQLIRDSVDYAPPFSINRKGLHKTLVEEKSRPIQKEVSAFRHGIQKINTYQAISHRLSWEGRFLATLSNDQIWIDFEKKINPKNEPIKQYFCRVRENWNIHQPFQYYSSEGLLFLLRIIVEYQHHFSQAHKELQRKKQTWIPFARLPSDIAESYEQFLVTELNKFTLLRKRVLDALLLRLKTAEQQGLVTCDDVSYALGLQSEWLSLVELKLPEYRTVLDTNTFNHMQRAIEKHGDYNHNDQLYKLAWYQYEKGCHADELTTITMSGSRLLAPKDLLAFMSEKKKKWFWFSSGNHIVLSFLEKQQALLAQLLLQPVRDTIILKPISESYPELLTLSTQYQLLQQSLFSLKQQRLYWWQWEKKFWKTAWQEWLAQQLEKKQVSLLDKLNGTFEEVKEYDFQLQNVMFREQVQGILETIRALINKGVSNGENESLVNMFKYIDENSRIKVAESVDKTRGSIKASPQTTESSSSSQPVNSDKDSYRKKIIGLWQTKSSVGNNGSVSTEKKSETNELKMH